MAPCEKSEGDSLVDGIEQRTAAGKYGKGLKLLQCAQQGEYNLHETQDWLKITEAMEGSWSERERDPAKTDCRTFGAGFCQFDARGA
jgi:hypothetical protein